MRFINEYSFLSNMYPCQIRYGGETFPCVETAFQYMKCCDSNDKKRFRKNGDWVDGFTARKLGRQVKLIKDWNSARLVIMYELLEEKFYNNEKLRKALKDTGDLYIEEENNWNDTFWGVCNGVGQNLLGKMIMEIRQNIIDNDKKSLKVIVAGTRSFNDYKLMTKKLDNYFKNVKPTIICGEARGADTLGKKYALEHGYEVKSFPADWSKGKSAGYQRNEEMADYADALVAFWNGSSKGTEHMIKTMQNMKKPVRIVKYT